MQRSTSRTSATMTLCLSILAGLCLFVSAYGQSKAQAKPPKTFVFVHGAWGGGWDYKQMESLLEAAGHRVYRPTLTGLGERVHLANPQVNLETHIQDIVNVLKFEDLTGVVLVGHSYGGMVITGVAHRVPERISRLVYVDAMLTLDGESMFDLMGEQGREFFLNLANIKGEGWKIPPFWPDPGKDMPQPLETFRQHISLGNPLAEKIPATYILTLEPGATTDDFSRHAERAKQRGWKYYELRTGHNPQRSMPKEYAEILMNE
ncbi:MAG: alpha/beta hydrolase [candidate division KSB1 bacterium]|nr:alpha/beta hydrolase [candidate division KSB1 bacterium]MDZ7300562.1 alpha/beta hydrolase [candidate division KSB1 bacterium]MDZ7309700.1 alpha/beta hydrolase [candidate division KSB1 bacterium]